MSYSAHIVADSIASGVRLTSIEATFPRFILAEINTHRMLSRNSASSRAIPVATRIKQVREDPFVPEAFTKNQKGMQAGGEINEQDDARRYWLQARDYAVAYAEQLAEMGVHKQHANRLLEPFAWHTALITATEWENFFNLRTHKDAQPEMQIIAKMMLKAMQNSVPHELDLGMWHLPYITAEDYGTPTTIISYTIDELVKISVARCAAVSYERQHAGRTFATYIQRHDELKRSAHWSPFEHQAQVHTLVEDWYGNFRAPWQQYRKMISGEAVYQATGPDSPAQGT